MRLPEYIRCESIGDGYYRLSMLENNTCGIVTREEDFVKIVLLLRRMKVQEIVAGIRMAEKDSEPNGWPAFQMKNLTELADYIEYIHCEELRKNGNQELHNNDQHGKINLRNTDQAGTN